MSAIDLDVTLPPQLVPQREFEAAENNIPEWLT